MKDRKFGTVVVNETQEVSDLNGLKQTVNIDTSDIENLSYKSIKSAYRNVNHTVALGNTRTGKSFLSTSFTDKFLGL